jgi:hypothetical protein
VLTQEAPSSTENIPHILAMLRALGAMHTVVMEKRDPGPVAQSPGMNMIGQQGEKWSVSSPFTFAVYLFCFVFIK